MLLNLLQLTDPIVLLPLKLPGILFIKGKEERDQDGGPANLSWCGKDI